MNFGCRHRALGNLPIGRISSSLQEMAKRGKRYNQWIGSMVFLIQANAARKAASWITAVGAGILSIGVMPSTLWLPWMASQGSLQLCTNGIDHHRAGARGKEGLKNFGNLWA